MARQTPGAVAERLEKSQIMALYDLIQERGFWAVARVTLSAPSIACLWAIAFALNKLTTRVQRRSAPIANSQVAARLVRSSPCGLNWVLLDRKILIFNNRARGMSVAYPQPSMTEHNEA